MLIGKSGTKAIRNNFDRQTYSLIKAGLLALCILFKN